MGVLWITGLSGSGKTTIAKEILSLGPSSRWIHLDGDELRQILTSGQRFDKDSRLELATQYSKLAKLISDQNYNVIVSTISLFSEIHQLNKESNLNYFEVYIECDVNLLRDRNDKNLYTLPNTNNLIGIILILTSLKVQI